MAASETAKIEFLTIFCEAARVHGLDAEAILVDQGIPLEALRERRGWVPLEKVRAAWMAAVAQSGDSAFGLHAAERLPFGGFDVIDYTGFASATLGDLIAHVARLSSLMTDDGTLSVTTGARHASIIHRARRPLAVVSELILTAIVVRGRQSTGTDWSPLSVSFTHEAPPPSHRAEYARVFRAPVRHGQPCDELVVERALLDLPLRTAEPRLAEILADYGRDLERRVATKSAGFSDVETAIGRDLTDGVPSLAETARRLGVTPRSLQRRLAEEGTTYRELVDHLRRRLAREHLEEARLPITKIAYLLGFSEPSALHRALRRWGVRGAEQAPPPLHAVRR